MIFLQIFFLYFRGRGSFLEGTMSDNIKGVATEFELSGLCSHYNMNLNMKVLINKLDIFNETTEDLIIAIRNYKGIK